MTAQSGNIDPSEMVLIHRVLRREFGLLPGLIRGAAGNPARARRLAAHASEMLDFLHVHHSGEDELVWPLLRPHASLVADLIDRMEAQHEQVAAAVRDVRAELPGWGASADAASGERIAARLEQMVAVLGTHLDEEEQQILPLIAQHFSQEQWDKLGKHGFAAVPGKRRLVILGHILEDADPTERVTFLHRVPPPARVAFRLIGRRQHARETADIRGG